MALNFSRFSEPAAFQVGKQGGMCWAKGNCSETAPGMLRTEGLRFSPLFSTLSLSLLGCNERNKPQAFSQRKLKGIVSSLPYLMARASIVSCCNQASNRAEPVFGIQRAASQPIYSSSREVAADPIALSTHWDGHTYRRACGAFLFY